MEMSFDGLGAPQYARAVADRENPEADDREAARDDGSYANRYEG